MASPEMSQIKDEWLDERCAVAHLADIANDQNFKWQEWAAPLGFPKFQEYEMSIYPDDQARKLLEEWYKRFGFKATYQHLMDIFINGGNAELAKKVRDLGESTKKECSQCSPLQALFLDTLRVDLSVFNRSDDKRFQTEIEHGITEYIEKSFKAGSSRSHLLEHLQILYTTEKLINSSAFEKSKQLILGQELHSKSLVTVSPLHLQSSSRPTLSLYDAYHSSLCCCALIKDQDCGSFKLTDQRVHFLKEATISQFRSFKQVVAISSDKTTFIAFQCELDLREWTNKYESFDKGIVQQSEEFPLPFILELLNKHTKVVLTGFLLGGLFALSIARQTWKSGLFSPRYLEEKLSCIMFSHPLISLPKLPQYCARYSSAMRGTFHAIFREDDIFPNLLKCLNSSAFSDEQTQHLMQSIATLDGSKHTRLEEDCKEHLLHLAGVNSRRKASLHVQRFRPTQLDQCTTYLLTPGAVKRSRASAPCSDSEMVERIVSLEKPITVCLVESMEEYTRMIADACQSMAVSPISEMHRLLVQKLEIYYFGSECVIAVEGRNLHFCNKLLIKDSEVSGEYCPLSRNALLIDVDADKKEGLHLPRQIADVVSIQIHCSYPTSNTVKMPHIIAVVNQFPTSVRQLQLSRVSPAKLIELSYLSALLEQSQKSVRAFSTKVDNIRKFLENIVKVVPIEAVKYADRYFYSYSYKEVIEKLRLGSLLNSDTTQSPTITDGVICDLGLDTLYSIASKSKGFQSPLDVLRVGGENLVNLKEKSLIHSETNTVNTQNSNAKMLDVVNKIRTTDLSLCISSIVNFITRQQFDIPLIIEGSNHVSGDNLCINTSAIAGRVHDVWSMIYQSSTNQILVRVTANIGNKDNDQDEINYAEKLHFLVQCLSENVTAYSKKFKSYSLERQLFSICQSLQITDSVSLSDLVNEWEQKFRSKTLSLVAKPYRPLIARWLKWALMVHNLREELAKYTAVGVVGLVNSGKSTLVRSLFQIETASGTTEEKRTTVPLIYNLEDKVDGLDVVDFPGVDDRDESISGLADLLLTLTQITIFVVDYRYSRTESSKKWLERLQDEKVPFLVCLTFADKLYAELAAKMFGRFIPHQYLPSRGQTIMRSAVKEELQSIRHALALPEEQKICFCSFHEEGMRDVEIWSVSDVGDWLVETFSELAGGDDVAQRLAIYLANLSGPIPPSQEHTSKLTKLLKALWNLKTSWKDLGRELGIPASTLETIETHHRGNTVRCFTGLLQKCMQDDDPELRNLKKAVLALNTLNRFESFSSLNLAFPSTVRSKRRM